MKKEFFLFILLLVCATACEKKAEDIEDGFTYPYSVSLSSVESGEIKMYVSSGEVTGQALIRDFLLSKQKEDRNFFFSAEYLQQFLPGEGQFTVVTSDSVEIPYRQIDGSYVQKPYRIIAKNGIEYWEDPDTMAIILLQIISPYKIGAENPGDISDFTGNKPSSFFFKYAPLYEELIPLPSTIGFSHCILYNPCLYVKYEQGRSMCLPLIVACKYINGIPTFELIQNELNGISFPQYLAAGDTLVVQERNYFFEKDR